MSKKRAPRPKSARSERREAERTGVKLAEAGLKLALLEPGGSPERPIEVSSASIVEPHASGLACVACGGSTRVEEHAARTFDGGRSLRIVRVRCTRCGVERDVYFRLGTTLAN
jgi:hypothetical protein